MIIRELTRQASLDLLTRIRLGRLACARANQPYIVIAHPYEAGLGEALPRG